MKTKQHSKDIVRDGWRKIIPIIVFKFAIKYFKLKWDSLIKQKLIY